MYCRNCGAQIADVAEICVKCGVRPFAEKHFCQECGSETKSNQEICIKCGVRLKTSLGAEISLASVNLESLGSYYQEEFKKIYESNEMYKGKWNWAAFFFTWIWALTKGLWLPAVIILALCFTGIGAILYWFVFGIRGNYMYYSLIVKNKQIPA
jgi:hypothetical protein